MMQQIYSHDLDFLHVNHHLIYRWGAARLFWHGPKEELDKLFQWVQATLPKSQYDIDKSLAGMTEHWETNRNISFPNMNAWIFVCQWWSETNAPDMYQPWKLKSGTPLFS